jgi:hypothetical protein
MKEGGSASIGIVYGGVVGLAFAENDPDEIVGACSVIAFLHFRRNLVVGLGRYVRKGDVIEVITEGTERFYVGHI